MIDSKIWLKQLDIGNLQNEQENEGIRRIWCPETDSNHRHEDFQSTALPTELSGHLKMWSRIKQRRGYLVKTDVQNSCYFAGGT